MLNTLYIEIQKFDRRLTLLFVILIAVYVGLRSKLEVFSNESLITLVSFIIVALFLYFLRLKTTIDKEKITIKMFPLTRKTVLWSDIESAEVIKYDFFAGWGIRLWTRYGTVYNMTGDTGLYIRLKSGKHFVIGTSKADEMKTFIENIH